MNKYVEFKKQSETETNAFYSKFAFFAFSDKQFEEGLEKLNLAKSGLKGVLVSIGAGGYMLKSKVEQARAISNRHNKRLDELMKDEAFAISAFDYELGNHEWCVTMDPTNGVEALGYSMKEVCKDEHLLKCLNAALVIQREWAMEHNW